jgi:serine/threonine-protein kinase RsbW
LASKCEFSSIQIPNDAKYGKAASIYVSEIARGIGMESPDLESLETGVEGAITALLGYSFESSEKGTLEILCERIPEGLKVSLRDKGLPFGTIGLQSDPNSTTEQILKLKEFLDEIQLNNLGPDGKELVLIKHLKNKSISDYYAACDLEPYESPPQPIAASPVDFKCRVRRMKPSDAPEVSKTIYRTYGYTYPHDYVYYPEKIIALNESGRVVSAVAVAENEEIAGYGVYQIWEENPRIAEMAQGVVKPEYRSLGCFRNITRYLLDHAGSSGITGAFGEAVTNHTVSQHTMHGFGFRDCGLRLGLIPPDTVFKGMNASVSHRVSMLVQFLYLQPPPTRSWEIFAPPHHAGILSELYKQLGVVPAINADVSTQNKALSSTAEFRIKLIGSMRFARIMIDRYGEDTIAALSTRIRELSLKNVGIINLFLNLSDPLTAGLIAQIEELGFFFAGILPQGFKNGDALILQYLDNVPIAYDDIQIKSTMARDLLSYVRKQDPNVN